MDKKYLIEGYIVEGTTIINEHTGETIPDMPATSLELSTRPHNVLMREARKICLEPNTTVHISDLLRMSEEDILRLRNMGAGSANEICDKIRKYLLNPEAYQRTRTTEIQTEETSTEDEYEVTDEGILVKTTGEILPDVPIGDLDLKPHLQRLLTEHGFYQTSQIYSMNLDELGEKITLGKQMAKRVREKAANALQQFVQGNQDNLSETDEDEINPETSFFQLANKSDKLKDQQREVLQRRMRGETLQEVSEKLNCSRERVRQIENAVFRILTNYGNKLFSEDQYAYLYQTYQVPKDFFSDYLKQSKETLYYLSIRYDHGKLKLLQAAEDENLTPEIREAVRQYGLKDSISLDGTWIISSRNEIEEYLIEHFCQNDTTLEQFAALYDRFITEHHLEGSELEGSDVYLNASRINRLANASNVLWKQNQRMRYYDTTRDMTELLDTLNLGQYKDIELSTRKFLLDYPELMEKYDIHDEYELHNLLKKIHAEAQNETLIFGRMPSLMFGSFDRDQAVKELIYANSPLTADELVRLISRKYGANMNTVRATWLKAAAVYYHHGLYIRPVEDDPIQPDISFPLPESQKPESAAVFTAASSERNSGGKKVLSPKEKLFRRIRREFQAKKYIGDIVITDEEFQILVSYLRSQCRYLLTQCELFECDEMLCTALVQIGIRYYSDGKYWPFVREILNAPQYKDSHFNWLGNAFMDFLRKKGKILIPDKKNIANILMHGFVSDKRANEFFDFLFMFYDIDLCRDIKRLKADKTLMAGLMDNIKSTGIQGRTYKLLEHTADAIRCNEKGGRIRLNRYLKMIDRAFWDPEDLPKQSGNRLTGYFLNWSSRSEKLQEERKQGKRSALKASGGWSPYLKYIYTLDEFRIILPTRLIRSETEPIVLWEIQYGENHKYIPAHAYEAVTGYMTEEQSYLIEKQHLFDAFELTLLSNGDTVRKWRIRKDQIRFFDLDGDQLETTSLRTGDAISFSAPDFLPESEAIRDKKEYGGLHILEYCFEDGDLIIFPDKQVLSIGRRPTEGLLTRNHLKDVYALTDGKQLPVWSAPPSMFARIHPNAKNGTQLKVNGQPYRLFTDQQPEKGVHVFDLQERVPEEGVQITLSHFGVTGNGAYHVELDIPHDHTNRTESFMLINGLSFSFDEAPYIFRDNGVLCIPEGTGLKAFDRVIKQENADGQDRFAFDIPEDDDWFRLSLDNIPVLFSIPRLSYRFQGEDQWQTKRHMPIWHQDMPRILEISYPADNIQLLLDEEGNDDEDDEQHFINFQKSKEQDLFICDLNPFASYYGRRVALRKLYIQVPGMEKPIQFLNIFTKSVFISAILKADYANDIINGELDIHGKAQYYADIWYGDELLKEKEPIEDGKLSIHTVIRNGIYKMDVYETDDDGFGFDNPIYELLDTYSAELINPSDLSNRHIEITHLEDMHADSYLRLKRVYRLYDLKQMYHMGKGYYTGHMVVTADVTGEYRNDYKACIHIPDPEELTKANLFMLDEYGDEEYFIYDNDRYIMRKDEDETVTGIFKYRRFRYLPDDEYLFRIKFIEKPKNLDNLIAIERDNRTVRLQAEKQNQTQKAFMRANDPLCRPITQLGLSVQTVNALIRSKIETSTDLYEQAFTQKGLMGIRNMGRRNIEECIYGLRKAGYSI